ncbi:MAG: hypothetical protein HRU30_13860 [Rhodobacteraceae bacterium]|nr:hypothetical protein [Paracoccaceae bacterium]
MAEKNFSLKDQLFNAESLGQLAAEYAAGLPGFDAERFCSEALRGIPERGLLECLDWFADCLEPHLSTDFPEMADQLQAMMPAPLDPLKTDDDFGHFIHAIPGILAVRHGLEAHRALSFTLLHAATQRFSMEFYIRPFINRWPQETLAQLHVWAKDPNYHVRRLVSEGTRPKLPWAKSISMTSQDTLPLLNILHADRTRYVTRSVANHLNDIAKSQPDAVVAQLKDWQGKQTQTPKELDWMRRHALRTLVKDGHGGALALLGYRQDIAIETEIELGRQKVAIGETLPISVTLTAPEDMPVIVDYRVEFFRPAGKIGTKVFKLKSAKLKAGQAMTLTKAHKFKGDATTFRLYPGPHRVIVQINGKDRAYAVFDLYQQTSG